tara:strand:- start:2248 stop:3270 length:1023 start_codon:yes stop_codon:yes gene_type:complete
MKLIGNWIKNNPIRTLFLIPIILVAAISISHVVTWYSIANPINWAIYLSIAIEVGAMTALVAATNRVKGGVWFMFGLVTFIQMVGNIYFSFKEIDTSGELWLSWIELTTPVWEMVGTDLTDTLALKRWLAFLEGGLLPVISLTSLHFFVRYDRNQSEEIDKEKIIKEYFDNRNKKMVDIVESRKKDKEDETEHLLKSEKNKEHLEESIEQAEEISKKIDEKDFYGESDEEVTWEEDPEVQEFLEKMDEPGSWSEEDDKIYTVGGLTADKEGDFMKFQKKQEDLEKKIKNKEKKESEILKKAIDEYQTKKEEPKKKVTEKSRLIPTEYGKVRSKTNIKRID